MSAPTIEDRVAQLEKAVYAKPTSVSLPNGRDAAIVRVAEELVAWLNARCRSDGSEDEKERAVLDILGYCRAKLRAAVDLPKGSAAPVGGRAAPSAMTKRPSAEDLCKRVLELCPNDFDANRPVAQFCMDVRLAIESRDQRIAELEKLRGAASMASAAYYVFCDAPLTGNAMVKPARDVLHKNMAALSREIAKLL